MKNLFFSIAALLTLAFIGCSGGGDAAGGGSAASKEDKICDVLNQVVDDIENDYKNIKTDPDASYSDATVTLPGVEYTEVMEGSYIAVIEEATTEEDLKASFEEWEKILGNCFSDWEKDHEVSDDYFLRNTNYSTDNFAKVVDLDIIQHDENDLSLEVAVSYY